MPSANDTSPLGQMLTVCRQVRCVTLGDEWYPGHAKCREITIVRGRDHIHVQRMDAGRASDRPRQLLMDLRGISGIAVLQS